VGSTGRIVRWGYKDEPQQIWLLLPQDLYGGKVRYRIMTKQNGEYMGVKSNGPVVRWGYSDDGSQIFMLKTHETSGIFLESSHAMNVLTCPATAISCGGH